MFLTTSMLSIFDSFKNLKKIQNSKKPKVEIPMKSKYKVSYQLHGCPHTYYKITDEEPDEMELDQYAWSLVEKI